MWWGLAPALAALIVFANTFSAGFVYDDETLIRNNPWVTSAVALPRLLTKPLVAATPEGTTNYYRPVVLASYNLLWRIGGGRPFPFHAFNVFLHMLNATLLLQLIRRVTGAQDVVAVGAAILFSVHPLDTSVVAWASCLPELGYTAFGLAALLLHALSWDREPGPAIGYRVAAWLSFTLACLCKETALAFIPLVAALEQLARPGRSAIRSALPYLGAGALVLAARTAVLGGLVPAAAHGTLTAGDVLLNVPWLLVLYVKAMLFPSPLLVEHVVRLVTTALDLRFVVAAVLVVLGAAAIPALARRRPDLAFAACLTIFPLIPALYLPALGRDPFAERYAYLGVAGFCWLVVGGADALLRRSALKAKPWALPALVTALTLVAGARTVVRGADWHDDGSLARASRRDEPAAAIGYLLMGDWQVRQGRKDEALRAYQEGVARVPDSAELQLNAIVLGSELGRMSPQDAVAALERLASAAPNNALIAYNLGGALLQAGRRDEARAAFLRSLTLAPTSVASLTALAVIAYEKGDDAASAQFCRQALAIDERSASALQQLGVALLRAGDPGGAIAAFEQAVTLDPADKEGLSRLGVAYAKSGRYDDARRAWERCLAIDPNFTKARQYLDRLRSR